MDTQTQAQIYLADQRGCSQLDYFRSFHTFNFGCYVGPDRKPFRALSLLNDDTLKAGHAVSLRVESYTEVIVIPLVGGLEYKSDVGAGFLAVGQVLVLSLTTDMCYQLSNPYEIELINYLVIWYTNAASDFVADRRIYAFSVQSKNELFPLLVAGSEPMRHPQLFRGYIGRYDGRKDDSYSITTPANGVFVFVISGAFEVQNRLLHERDGLALTTVKDGLVEFEALSNDALLLVLEVPNG